ncbi:MAG: DPP IV N-terminal domain-containing protein [Desulfobulbaceae bacterium]|jgi:TolB protein|nr:DPP IV N-terminal domain-containing protein [Desulfobulbaceae bacterium]
MSRIHRAVFPIFLIVCILFPFSQAMAEPVHLTISASETRKIQFAVPDLAVRGGQQQLGSELADILSKALTFHGIISVVPASNYGNNPNTDWKKLGVDYVVTGNCTSSGQSLSLELRLLEAASGDQVVGKTYTDTNTDRQRHKMLYKFCDEVINALTGKPGIASSQIAYVFYDGRVKEAYITDILGSYQRRVTRHQNLVISPRFSRDGNYLTYSSYHSGNQSLYITDLRQSSSTTRIMAFKGLNYGPAYSPDGRTMVVTLSKDGNPDLYLCTPQGRIIERLTQQQGINTSASWSPDGTRIAFVSDRTGKPQVYVMDMRTRQVQRVSFDGGSESAEPSWSPTEDLIAYSSLIGGVYQLFLVRPGQGNSVQITDDLSHHEAPNWSPDGNQIIYARRGGRAHQLCAILKNGTNNRPLFNFAGDQTYPQWSR